MISVPGASTSPPGIRIGFVLHAMQVAGAEVLVAETIRRLGAALQPVVFCLDAVGSLGEQLQSEGVPVLSFGRRPGIDLAVSRRMAVEISARQLDVLHMHQYTPFFYGAIAARLSRRHPVTIFTEHGRHYPDVVSVRRRWTNRFVLDRMADHINAVCAFSAERLSVLDGFAADRIEVIENGIDLSRYERTEDVAALRARLGLAPARRYITTVARFHQVKDHRTLLSAFEIACRTRPDVDLLLAGDGELRSELESQVRQRSLGGRVRFLGVRHDIPDILKASDLFALTSLSEAASITLLEAMASELPVVVTEVGGNPEIVRAGVDGLLAPRGDVEGIATALARVLDDDGLRRTLARAAGRRVRSRYHLDRTVGRYFDLYSGSISRRRAA